MEYKKPHRLLEWGKDLLILLLACSALYLLGRTQLYDSQPWWNGLAALFSGGVSANSAQPSEGWGQGGVLRPARLALRSDVSRYGVQYDNARAAELFAQLTNPLSDALAGAGAPASVSQRVWQAALAAPRPSIYLDFLGPVPLADLTSWLSGGRDTNPNLTASARRLLLAQNAAGAVELYYINADDGLYYVCAVGVDSLPDRLAALVDGVPNNAVFAFEDPERYGALAPDTLICQETPQPAVYAAANPIPLPNPLPSPVTLSGSPALDELVRGLSFPPQSYTAYPIIDGVSLQEGGDRLTVTTDGTVTFRAAREEAPRYPIAAADSSALWAAVDGAWAFVDRTVSPLCGESWLYLSSLEVLPDGGVEICFSYQLDGAVVYLGEEGYAAKVLIRSGAIEEFALHLRCYTATDETTLVLQEHRAAAAMRAQSAAGAELMLCYRDQGGGQVSADWTAW